MTTQPHFLIASLIWFFGSIGYCDVKVPVALKYELPISMHVLTNTDHHPEFEQWASGMRQTLPSETLKQIEVLTANIHEWQLANLFSEYQGPSGS